VDAANHSADTIITVFINDLNEAPTDLTLSVSAIAENATVGSLVGVFSTTDQDFGETFNYTVLVGSSTFTTSGSSLRTVVPLDYEQINQYNVTVNTIDHGGLSFTKTFLIKWV